VLGQEKYYPNNLLDEKILVVDVLFGSDQYPRRILNFGPQQENLFPNSLAADLPSIGARTRMIPPP
jgi:hypothetical protein